MAEESVLWNTLMRSTARFYKKKKPQKFLEQWMEEVKLTDDPAMQKLLQASVFLQDDAGIYVRAWSWGWRAT